MTDFTRDEHHVYRLNGNVIPSVTQVLRETGLATDHTKTDPFYAERGTAVHEAIRLDLLGELDESTLDENVKPKFDVYRAAKDMLGLTDVKVEVPMYHPDELYAGTIDLMGYAEGLESNILIDWKTGAFEKWHDLQLAAYEEMAHTSRGIGFMCGVVSLAQGPLPKIHWSPYGRFQKYQLFLAALKVYRARQVYG